MLENNVMAVFVQGNYLRSYILAFERRFFSLYLSVWKKIVLCEIFFPNLIARFVCFFVFFLFYRSKFWVQKQNILAGVRKLYWGILQIVCSLIE